MGPRPRVEAIILLLSPHLCQQHRRRQQQLKLDAVVMLRRVFLAHGEVIVHRVLSFSTQ